MFRSLSLTFSIILVMSAFSKADGAALKTDEVSITPTQSPEKKSAIEYYSELLTQLVHAFPEVDKQDLLTNYQKRMYGRYGRTIERVSELYPSIAAELRAELDRRKLTEMRGEKTIHDSGESPESGVSQLKQMEERIANLERKLLKEDNKAVKSSITEQEKPSTADSELERDLLRMLEGETMAPKTPPTDRGPLEYEHHPTLQGLSTQIESTQDQLAKIIAKLSQIEDNSQNKDMLDSLSKQLASNKKSEDNSPLDRQTTTTPATTTTATSSNIDKLTQLASIVKNLIEVNQLAYLQLQDQIKESR